MKVVTNFNTKWTYSCLFVKIYAFTIRWCAAAAAITNTGFRVLFDGAVPFLIIC